VLQRESRKREDRLVTAQRVSGDVVTPPTNLRGQALKGGAFLAGRHSVSLVIHLLGVTLLTRAIGPHDYGLYVGAFGVQMYLYAVSQLGLIVFLVRHGGVITDAEFDQAFTLLGAIGVTVAATVYFALPTVEQWIGIEAFAPVGRVLAVALPIQLLALVPMGRLERALNYRAIAPVELGGYLMFYAVALPLAHSGLREWAPVAGFLTQQSLVAIGMYAVAGYRPSFRWDPRRIREMLGYGVRYSGALWIWQLRDIVNPIIVGRFAGPAAVALVALTIRLVDALSFVKGVGWRVSLSVLGRLQKEPVRMVRAASEGMQLQTLALGGVLAGFGLVSRWAIPRLLGAEWTTVSVIFPFVAISYLAHAIGQFEIAMLNVVDLTRRAAEFHLLHLVLFAGSALILVPRLGPLGYGWSEVAALPSYALLHVYTRRFIGGPDWRLAGLWWLAFVSLLFWHQIGWFSVVVPVIAMLWPGTLQQLRKYMVSARQLRYAE
jgi:O-antigen/teichoic acid export membrane protein